MSDHARGRCPECDRDLLLKKDGTLRHHGGERQYGWPQHRRYRCEGTGRTPVTTTESPAVTE